MLHFSNLIHYTWHLKKITEAGEYVYIDIDLPVIAFKVHLEDQNINSVVDPSAYSLIGD